MAKFIYKMQNILTIKFKMEEQAKTAYGNARLKLTEEEEKLNALHQKVIRYQERIRNIMQSTLKLLEIRQCEEAIEITKYHIKLQQISVKKAEQQLEAARVRLNAAILERKTHEKLKEKSFEEFKQEFESEQRKEIDELVSYKYNSPTEYQEET
ncbi:MAG: flagellar export protein FliJ [Anaerocolumna sp.]|jgi:flagellar FliJ protein|nr:flagellar export protein FliJ [Anaerocolumna sp.]